MKYFLYLTLCLSLFACTTEKKDENKIAKEVVKEKISLTKKVFILQSYEAGHICGEPQESGIREVLQNSRHNFEFESYYMDTKTKNVTPDAILQQSKIAIDKIKNFSPDILFVLDDNAIKNVAFKLLDQPFKIFFSGMNGIPQNYNIDFDFLTENNLPTKNMTGIYEYLYSMDSFNTIRKILPEKHKVIAIIDKTPTGNAVFNQLQQELQAVTKDFFVEIVRISTMKEYAQVIKKINSDTEYFAVYNIALSLKDDNNKQVGVKTTFKYFIDHCKVPGIALNYAFSRLGLFGGAAVDFEAMGKQAAEMSLKYINGDNFANLQVEDAQKYMLIFNEKRAEDLGIKIPNELKMAADRLYKTIKLNEKN